VRALPIADGEVEIVHSVPLSLTRPKQRNIALQKRPLCFFLRPPEGDCFAGRFSRARGV
jgi:hypothetical protein